MRNYIYYRFKTLLGDKMMLFWTLLFPVALALFFSFTLVKVYSTATAFEAIEVAVPQTLDNQSILKAVLPVLEEEDLILVNSTKDLESAKTQLQDGEISAIIQETDGIVMTVKSSTSDSTILKMIFDQITQKTSMLERIFSQKPELAATDFINEAYTVETYTTQIKDDNMSFSVIYFYSLMAMEILYGIQWGVKSTYYLQAQRSPAALRTNIAPMSRLKLVLIDIGVVFVITAVEVLLLYLFIRYPLNISFGNQVFWVIAASLAALFTAIALGYFISVYLKGEERHKEGLATAITLTFSFSCGMQYPGLKYLVGRYLPWFATINPAYLLTDSYYTLYYGKAISIVEKNIMITLAIGVIAAILAAIRLRGDQYDSL
ncbi:MAG: ABC transporter permease [Erysipelotrichaceae bacterium]|jgi:ABC-2 type transport system permease protein|nr:ABC transporter permease [Erysipelotrichaceae bacterium]